ncbi:tautomerase PptA [Klebsiella sp. BIGb0407]|uniref:tautomerase PptA n=1 Tax=Klebsiella sp. BIGb0407 TaxID=2940603 RepID=UPI0021696A35|nr:tautomerase PptA [Klebsiella sp. BIGb0407]MCS3429796.1 4-oxalocrotonate tautomerase [Klebsiella sp. BIGb0407]
MPHIEIKCFPRDLTAEQKQVLATELCDVLKKHLGSKDESLSVALQMVEQSLWKSEVWDTQIAPQMEQLLKKPGYQL